MRETLKIVYETERRVVLKNLFHELSNKKGIDKLSLGIYDSQSSTHNSWKSQKKSHLSNFDFNLNFRIKNYL